MPSASHENLSPNGLKGNFEPGRCPPMSTDSLLPSSAKTELQHRLDICIAGRWMYEQGYNVACEGNVSVRLDDKRILTTPTCMNKGMLAPEDLVVTDLDGRQLSGQRKFSSELAMHLLFYNMRPDVNVGLGRIPLVRYATPGTPELSAALEPFVPHYDALLLANHGAVTCGPDLLTAYFRLETKEPVGKIPLAGEMAGSPTLLSSREVAKLMAARSRYFVTPPPGGGAELPITSDTNDNGNDVRLTRGELDTLIDEAV